MTLFMIALGAGVVVAIWIVASLGPIHMSGWYDDEYDGGTVCGWFDGDWGSSDSDGGSND